MSRAVRVVIDGRVQGVGFRYFARRAACELGVRGWVRNLPDGRVETAAVADDEAVLDAFVGRLRKGPPGARVDGVVIEELAQTPAAAGFDVRV